MTDFNVQLQDLDGEGLFETVMENGLPKKITITLGRVAANALLQHYPDEAHLPGADKVKRFELAMKVSGAKNPKLDAEDIVLLKERIAKAYGPLIVGRAWQLLSLAVR